MRHHTFFAPGAILSGALLLVGCAPPTAPTPVVPSVFVSTVRNHSGASERVLPASLRPRVESDLSFRAGGKVTARTVELGQGVRAGQVLGRIDAADYQLAVQAAADQQRAAEVDAAQAASDAARFNRLLADGSVGAADAERQQARADAAAARLAQTQRQAELARNRVGHAVLTAPYDGTVTAVRFEAGQVVADGQPVLSLARPGELELQADVPEALVAGLKGWQASARLVGGETAAPGGGTQDIALRLREVAPSATAASRTFRARYALGALPAGTEWRMGMTAELRLLRPGGSSGAELPASALLFTGAATDGAPASSVSSAAPQATAATSATPATPAPAVWRVDPKTGALQRTPVQLLSQTTDHVRVAGLSDGAWVVSVGAQKLDAGLKVQPVPRPLAVWADSAAAR